MAYSALPPSTLEALRAATTLPPSTLEALRDAMTLPPSTVEALHGATRIPQVNWRNFYGTPRVPLREWRAAMTAMTASLSAAAPAGWEVPVDDALAELEGAELDADLVVDLGWIQRLTYRQRILLLLALHPILNSVAQFVEDVGGGSVPPEARSGVTLVVATVSALMLALSLRDDLKDN